MGSSPGTPIRALLAEWGRIPTGNWFAFLPSGSEAVDHADERRVIASTGQVHRGFEVINKGRAVFWIEGRDCIKHPAEVGLDLWEFALEVWVFGRLLLPLGAEFGDGGCDCVLYGLYNPTVEVNQLLGLILAEVEFLEDFLGLSQVLAFEGYALGEFEVFVLLWRTSGFVLSLAILLSEKGLRRLLARL